MLSIVSKKIILHGDRNCSYTVAASNEELVLRTASVKLHQKPEEMSPELKAKMKESIKPEQETLWFR